MAGRRKLTLAGLAGAGLVGAVAGITAINRAAVRRFQRGPDPVEPGELELPEGVAETLITLSDGATARIVARGPKDGRPVVLLHGITLGAEVWPYQLRDLPGEGMRVLAVDLRGHGGSAPPGRSQLTLDRMASDVSEILDELDLEGAVIVGHSMGGMVALRMLGADPWTAQGHGRVAALLLVATTANATRRRGLPGLSELIAVSQPLMSSGAGLACRLPGPTLPANDLAFLLARITFGDFSSPRQVRFTGELTSDVPVRVSAELMVEIIRYNAEEVLPTISLPTMVVVGDHDLMTPLSQSEYITAHIKGSSITVLPGCGHMVMLERPDELNKAIVELAARV
jgi:pimeloyl-ACP methyl ester carboxylesterase